MKKKPIKLKETARVKEYNDVLRRVAYIKKTGQIEILGKMITIMEQEIKRLTKEVRETL